MYGANVIIFEGILTFYNVDVLKVSQCIVRKTEWVGLNNSSKVRK